MMKISLILTALLGTNLAMAEDPIGRCTGKLAFGNEKIQIMTGTLMIFPQGDLDPIDTIKIKLQLKTAYDETISAKGTMIRSGDNKTASLAVDMPHIGKISGKLTLSGDHIVVNAKDEDQYPISGILKCRYK